jgi:hypothetical protein
MSTEPFPVGDLTATVKSREVQRAMLAEMAGDRAAAARHFLAAAHLELVLAEDYTQAAADDLALRSRLSAASCFWRAGQTEQAQSLFHELLLAHPDQNKAIQHVLEELKQDSPAQAS